MCQDKRLGRLVSSITITKLYAGFGSLICTCLLDDQASHGMSDKNYGHLTAVSGVGCRPGEVVHVRLRYPEDAVTIA